MVETFTVEKPQQNLVLTIIALVLKLWISILFYAMLCTGFNFGKILSFGT